MKGNAPRYSRINRKKMRNRSNQLLNMMIGLVVVLIIIVGASIIFGGNGEEAKVSDSGQEEIEQSSSVKNDSQREETNSNSADGGEGTSESSSDEGDEAGQSTSENEQSDESTSTDGEAGDDEESLTVPVVPDDDGIIVETIINSAWQPIGTTQTGVHESKYDLNSVDWEEKQKAISYATGHSVEELIYWKIKNGGGPQKSIGIVSTRDKSKKYRVFLEWVDEKGWKPVQMDILNTLDFEY
ncbi:DUF1510 family protein [Sporosarcina sp. UB5]|uniref:YrrS family protein n=1 Tax=Sporosarcina sp. UB5 TaxID=3047463 RepID=UPI003D78C568